MCTVQKKRFLMKYLFSETINLKNEKEGDYSIPYVLNVKSYIVGKSRHHPPPSRVNQKLPSSY